MYAELYEKFLLVMKTVLPVGILACCRRNRTGARGWRTKHRCAVTIATSV